MRRLDPGFIKAATIRKCGQVYIPFRVLGKKEIGAFADIFYEERGNDVRVVIVSGDDVEVGRAVVYEACGVALHIAPLYNSLNWGKQVNSYKVPVVVKDDSFEFVLKKDLHQGV
jgi:hypothetical protein